MAPAQQTSSIRCEMLLMLNPCLILDRTRMLHPTRRRGAKSGAPSSHHPLLAPTRAPPIQTLPQILRRRKENEPKALFAPFRGVSAR
jgi:hypothetical protein